LVIRGELTSDIQFGTPVIYSNLPGLSEQTGEVALLIELDDPAVWRTICIHCPCSPICQRSWSRPDGSNYNTWRNIPGIGWRER